MDSALLVVHNEFFVVWIKSNNFSIASIFEYFFFKILSISKVNHLLKISKVTQEVQESHHAPWYSFTK